MTEPAIGENGDRRGEWLDQLLSRCFELMIQYADRPMDLADASLVALAEAERLNKILTIDRSDFATYRIKRGHRHYQFEVVG
jgi:hypothetical protein